MVGAPGRCVIFSYSGSGGSATHATDYHKSMSMVGTAFHKPLYFINFSQKVWHRCSDCCTAGGTPLWVLARIVRRCSRGAPVTHIPAVQPCHNPPCRPTLSH
eukprot:scaffold220069_cov18-Tisochrysis_lutea.AAC.1